MFQKLGRFCATYPWLVIAAWLAVGCALTFTAPNWDSRTQDDDIRFLPERCPSVRAYQILEKAFPQEVFASRLIFAIEREDNSLTDQDLAIVDQMVADLEQLRKDSPESKIGRITSYKDGLVGSRLTSGDRHCTLIQLSLGTPFLALQTHKIVAQARDVLKKRIDAAGPDAPKLYTTGQAGIGHDLVQACGDSLDQTTVATIILVVVILLCVYRSPVLALVPLLTIAASVWVALHILAWMTMLPGVYLVNISKIFAIVILYGAGTDYCLFLISRYREELETGVSNDLALMRCVGSVGGALTASAGTVMCGLGLMSLAEFAKVRYSGPGIALSLGVALLAALTLTPALLRILGDLVFWPGPVPRPQPRYFLDGEPVRRRRLWERISYLVVNRPGLVFTCSILLLLPLAILGAGVTPDYRATSQLSPSSPSLQGLEVLKKHFNAGETGPLTVLLTSTHDWDEPNGHLEIDHLSQGFASLPNVAEVRSLTQPLGKPLPDDEIHPPTGMAMLFSLVKTFQPNVVTNALKEARKAATQYYVSRFPTDAGSGGEVKHVTRIDIIMKSDPFDAASMEAMQLVQTWLQTELPQSTLIPDVQTDIYGVMVGAHDLAEVTEKDRVRVNTLISVGIFLILILIVRRPLLAGYLLLTVLFSYLATLGATMLAGWLWSGHFLHQLDWRVMFFLFTILVAVGEDYNILLISRAVQEQRRHGVVNGMRRALACTGGIITSCGLIMAGTFATLMLANLNTLLQIGFALAFGVLLDTFIVRPFLVPSFAIWLEKLVGKSEQARLPRRDKKPTGRKRDPVPEALRIAG